MEQLIRETLLLLQAFGSSTIDTASNLHGMILINKNKILEEHKKNHKYYNSKTNGLWFTYLPVDLTDKRGKLVKKKTQEKLDDTIIKFYLDLRKEEKKENLKVYTFEEIYQKWRQSHDKTVGKSSISKYNSDYLRFFELQDDFTSRDINSLTFNTICDWINDMIDEYGFCTAAVKGLVKYISKSFEWAYNEEIISKLPTLNLKLRLFTKKTSEYDNVETTEEKQYSQDEIKHISLFIRNEIKDNPSYFALYGILIATLTGCRVGEISGLKWADIELNKLNIQRSVKYDNDTNSYFIGDTKTGKSRYFPIHNTLNNLFEEIKEAQTRFFGVSEYILCDESLYYLHPRILSSCNKNKLKKMGLKPKNGIHGYRFALSSELRKKYSRAMVASMMGHSEEVNDRHYNDDTTSDEEKLLALEELFFS